MVESSVPYDQTDPKSFNFSFREAEKAPSFTAKMSLDEVRALSVFLLTMQIIPMGEAFIPQGKGQEVALRYHNFFRKADEALVHGDLKMGDNGAKYLELEIKEDEVKMVNDVVFVLLPEIKEELPQVMDEEPDYLSEMVNGSIFKTLRSVNTSFVAAGGSAQTKATDYITHIESLAAVI